MAPTMDLAPQERFELLIGRRFGLMKPWAKVLTRVLINRRRRAGLFVVAKTLHRCWSVCAMVAHYCDKSNLLG